jgi:regulator of RNase E activity RraA
VRRDEGQVGVIVSFAGVVFEPGAFVYVDRTGIVVANRRLTET